MIIANRGTLVLSLFVLCMYMNIGQADDLSDWTSILKNLLIDVRLRKCSCDGSEVLVDGNCFSINGTTVPVLSRDDPFYPIIAEASFFDVIAHSPMRCGHKKYVTHIVPRDLFILFTGELLHLPSNKSFSPFEFCVDHVLDQNQEVTWVVEMCLEAIKVPVCCPFTRDEQKYCKSPALPLGYGFSSLKDATITTVPGRDVRCKENDTLSKTEISEDPSNPTSSVYISYHDHITQLVVYSSSDDTALPRYLSSNEFCIVPEVKRNKVRYKAAFCARDPVLEHQIFCKDFSCVRKCCPQEYLYSHKARRCVPIEEIPPWTPIFRRRNDSTEVDIPHNLKLSFGFPICKKSFYAFKPNDSSDHHILLDTGEIFIFEWDSTVSSPRYCMDNFLTHDNTIAQKTLTCFPDEVKPKSPCNNLKKHILPILLVISCVFLFITLVVYATIPDLHAKLHGKSLLSHITALFMAYFFLAMAQWLSRQIPMALCVSFGFIIQITFLASFFWLNVMCFDIWWTLRSMRPVPETSDSFRRRFIYYSVYAWGCPLVIGLVTIMMHFLPSVKDSDFVLPGFGRRNCLFGDRLAQWVYFYGFISILTVANITFFICVAVILIQAQMDNNVILRTSSKQNQERVWIYLKLFIVMGITWVCEVISFEEGSCEYWLFFDIVNALQGFFIFLIFICKRNIFVKLHARGTDSTRKIRRMVQGSSSYGSSSSQVTQQSSLDTTRKFSVNLQHHLSKLNRFSQPKDDAKEPKKY